MQTTRLLKLHKTQEITFLVIQNITHLQQHRNPHPKNTNKNPIKFAKKTCITQQIVTTCALEFQITKRIIFHTQIILNPIHT